MGLDKVCESCGTFHRNKTQYWPLAGVVWERLASVSTSALTALFLPLPSRNSKNNTSTPTAKELRPAGDAAFHAATRIVKFLDYRTKCTTQKQMATPVTATRNASKNSFACFPFKFLFGGDKDSSNGLKKKDLKNGKGMHKPGDGGHGIATSDTATASYEGGSSVMSVDGEGTKTTGSGTQHPTTEGGFGVAVNAEGVRTIAGYEIRDTLGKGMSGKVKRGYNTSR